MPRKPNYDAHLLVEGPDDFHLILALCQHWAVPESFDVLTPVLDGRSASGIDQLLENFRLHLKAGHTRAIGLVLDADSDAHWRWQQISRISESYGYHVPATPAPGGTILAAPQPHQPQVGVWIMPDNQTPGELEDFVSNLIPQNDALRPYANSILTQIEEAHLQRYRHKRSKAFVHTWLAWQENPGMPMGQAVTAKALSVDSPIAQTFADWLNRLFNS